MCVVFGTCVSLCLDHRNGCESYLVFRSWRLYNLDFLLAVSIHMCEVAILYILYLIMGIAEKKDICEAVWELLLLRNGSDCFVLQSLEEMSCESNSISWLVVDGGFGRNISVWL